MAIFTLLAFLPFSFFGLQLPAESIKPPIPQESLHGIYLTSTTIGSPQGQKLVDDFAAVGGNMIVFDIQTSGGRLAYQSNIPLSVELKNSGDQIKDLAAIVKNLHEKGFYSVARFVLFKNGFLAAHRPQWTLKNRKNNRPFVSRDGPIWLDPGNPELAEYLTAIAEEIASAGVDEIQFDYVRFPEGGKGGYVGYSFADEKNRTRDQSLTYFISRIADILHYSGVAVGIDVFGIVVWDNISWKVIGQNIGELSKYVDAIYPMPYPSHFGPGWGGHANPADEPYFFVQETTKKFLEQTRDTDGTQRVKIRPWLQGFTMRVSRFGPQYIKDQIRALTDIGIDEYSVWNASNNYSVTLKALRNP